jgi:hypothetical protein
MSFPLRRPLWNGDRKLCYTLGQIFRDLFGLGLTLVDNALLVLKLVNMFELATTAFFCGIK